ncbi:MAG: S-methyl-5-thioribose-1-phosphate isomerase, partial [Caldilineaceae bacterium]|nr:S-methyl-5-thioribose-1-phosphate isomerase [Caldilineaceae bacterium]
MRTVYWQNNQVAMIDQRILPLQEEIVTFDSVEGVAFSIADMVVRGAPAIGATGAYGMALAAQQSRATTPGALIADLRRAKVLLDEARPTAVNLSWATARMLGLAEESHGSVDAIRAALLAEAEALADEDVEINRRMGFNGAEIVPEGANILHHCNTGALAAVDFGTALGVIFACHELGKAIHVWVDETRPRLQGARLTAWELMRAGVPMHLIADNAAGHLMKAGKVDVVLYGADRVAANGDVANKIGSYKLAVVARENG